MAVFTTEQADLCKINRCDSFKTDGTHNYYVFSVEDDNGIVYEWKDSTLVAAADHSQVRVAIHDYLVTIEKLVPTPVKSVDSDPTIIGQTVGGGSPV